MGKLAFASLAGGMIDYFGLETMFIVFTIFAVLTVPFAKAIPGEEDEETDKKN